MQNGRVIDSSWIVPYSPYLLLKYQCHINVECCLSVRGVKYLYKYVHKGPDRAMVALRTQRTEPQPVNEIQQYQDLRSMGSSEGCWRTFNFAMYSRSPPVHALCIHLENGQRTYFVEGGERQALDAGPPTSELTAWFECVRNLPPADRRVQLDDRNRVVWCAAPFVHIVFALCAHSRPCLRNPVHASPCTRPRADPHLHVFCTYLRAATYPSWPERFKYESKRWKPRARWSVRTEDVQQIGRVHNAHPNSGELFYLRMLLHHIPANELALDPGNADAFTFDALKYFQGEKQETYKGAAMARNLLQDDAEWHLALTDAQESASPMQMRALYLAIVEYNQPEAPVALFDAFWIGMGDDFAHHMREAHIPFTQDGLRLRVMLELEETLESNGKSLVDVCGLQLDDAQRAEAQRLAQQAVHAREPKAIRDELTPSGERATLQAETDAAVRKLLPAQKAVFDAVMSAVTRGAGRCLFVDAPGGTGKTFTFNVILGAVRARGEIALAVASSGIAAILLEKGRTFHARFCASRKPAEDQVLSIPAQSTHAQLLRRATVILWDEAAMGNKHHLDALDRTLRDFMQNDEPFGGKIILLGGDYRQTLPIQRGASRAQTVRICLSQSHLWRHFEIFKLTTNMRIQRMRETLDASDGATRALLARLQEFAEWLLALGSDTLAKDESERVALPSSMCLEQGCDLDALVDWVYPNLAENCSSTAWLSQRAILAPRNSDVDEVCARALYWLAHTAHPPYRLSLCAQINAHLTERFPGEEWTCKSADAIDQGEPDESRVGEEVLNSFNGPGLPLHQLKLKPNMPVMLLRNLDPTRGLCNGTRLLVLEVIHGRVLKARIVTGAHAGDVVFIPRIRLSAEDGEFPFKWSRRQFPVRIGVYAHVRKTPCTQPRARNPVHVCADPQNPVHATPCTQPVHLISA